MQIAGTLGFDETETGNVGLVVTEAAKNLLKHAGGGDILLRRGKHQGAAMVEMLALDKGPGIANLTRSFEDGYSTCGTPGTGLGAISRLAAFHDIYSQPRMGTALLAQIWKRSSPARSGRTMDQFQLGAVSVAKTDQPVCGDAWGFAEVPRSGARLIVADGLGHGLAAADASGLAVRVHAEHPSQGGTALMQTIHEALRPTRGAAVALAEIDKQQQVVRYTGLGNITGCVVPDAGAIRQMVSHAGTAGHEMHRIVEFRYPWDSGCLLVLCSDGLLSHWSLDRYPGLARRHPSLIAGILYRDFNRGRDDATVVVVRQAGAAA